MAGYIKDHRKELDSDIWAMPPLYHRVWQYLKYKVNHTDVLFPQADGSDLTVKKGQHLSTLRDIAEGVSWMEGRVKKVPNPHTISKILEFMVKRNMISIDDSEKSVRGNRKYTLISLINWEKYQIEDVRGNSDRHSEVTLRALNNNDKELNNIATTTGAYAYESQNVAEPIQEISRSPLIQLQDTYCNMHGKLDVNLNVKERMLMRQMIDGDKIPVDFAAQVMKTVHDERIAEGGTISSFLYYKNPIYDAWRSEQALTTFVPTEGVALGGVLTESVPTGTVALDTTRRRKTENAVPIGPAVPNVQATQVIIDDLELARQRKQEFLRERKSDGRITNPS